jgi:hypothetical protein
MRKWASYSLLLLFVVTQVNCSLTSLPATDNTEPFPHFGDYRQNLRNAGSDQERWLLTIKALGEAPSAASSSKSQSAAESIRLNLIHLTVVAELWLDYYPNILDKVHLSRPDLMIVSGCLGSTSHGPKWSYTTQITQGELAERLLRLETGMHFDSAADYQKWSRDHPETQPS